MDDWTPEILSARQERLVEQALSVYTFEIPVDVARAEEEANAWFVQQNPDSRYRDREGEVYDYPYSIPNAQQIGPGDILVCYRAQRIAPGEQRIFGIGRVGTIFPDGDRLLAVYDRYLMLDPARSFDDIGGDPRNNQRNAINALAPDVIRTLLDSVGLPDLSEAELIEPDIDELVEIGTEPAFDSLEQ